MYLVLILLDRPNRELDGILFKQVILLNSATHPKLSGQVVNMEG
jgi:hypothetical protein